MKSFTTLQFYFFLSTQLSSSEMSNDGEFIGYTNFHDQGYIEFVLCLDFKKCQNLPILDFIFQTAKKINHSFTTKYKDSEPVILQT